MDSAAPRFQISKDLKLLPVFWSFEDVDVRLNIGGWLIALQLLGDHAIMKLRFDRNRCRDVAVNEMINEVLGLGVFPLFGMNCERFFAERIRIALAER